MAIADFPFTFASQPIIDPTTGQPVLNAAGGVLLDPRSGTSLSMADMNGNPVTEITGNAYGQSMQFRSTQLAVLVKFGAVNVQAPSIELFDLVQTASNAVSLAQSAQQAALAAANSVDYSGNPFLEAVQDLVAAMFAGPQSTGVTVTYDDNAGKFTITLAGGGTGGTGTLDTEGVQDVIGAMVTQAGGSYNDAAGTITFPTQSVSGATISDTSASGSTVYSSSKIVDLLKGFATLSNNKVPISQIPTGTIATLAPGSPHYEPYPTAYAAANRSVIMGTRTDCPCIVTGQRVVIANGVVIAQDPSVPWLVGQDQSLVTPVASLS